jgi:hypothetical protein
MEEEIVATVVVAEGVINNTMTPTLIAPPAELKKIAPPANCVAKRVTRFYVARNASTRPLPGHRRADRHQQPPLSYGVDTNWYTDTGATDHITGELDKLMVRDKYHNTDRDWSEFCSYSKS